MYKCENCGGDLIFDPKSQQMKCQSCSTLFPIDASRDKDIEVQEDGAIEADVFVCPNCGGELIGATESMVDFCPYCGTQVATKTQKIAKQMPEAIVPFSVTKDQVKDIYRKSTKKFIFAPSEMKSDKYLDKVQGVYVPYWSYFCDVHGHVINECVDEHRSGDYIIKRYYDISADMQGQAVVSYDASKELDDDLSQGAGGFKDETIKKFTPQYLSGYYADLPDVPAEVHVNDANQSVRAAAANKVMEGDNMKVLRYDTNGLNINVTPRRTAMPLYFLTWRDQNKVSYSLINGQSGKFSGKLPIETKKFVLTSILFAIPLFLLFFFMPKMIMPLNLSVFSGFIMLFAMLAAVITGKQAYNSEKAVFETPQPQAQAQAKTSNMPDLSALSGIPGVPNIPTALPTSDSLKKLLRGVISFIILLIVAAACVTVFGSQGSGAHHSLIIMRAIILIIGIILFIIALVFTGMAKSKAKLHPEGWFNDIAKCMGLAGFPALIGILLSGALTFINLTYDGIYYGIAIYTFVIAILIFFNVIDEYNFTVTRPSTYFERRKGLNDYV